MVAALPLLFGAPASAAPADGSKAGAGHELSGPRDRLSAVRREHRPASSTTPLALASQTPWVTAAQPWFNLGVGVGEPVSEASSLHVNLTFYNRIDDASQFQQALSSTPQKGVLGRMSDIGTADVDGRLAASACVTVMPDADATPPASGPGACAVGGTTLVLGCTLATDTCGGVYPVSVALVRQGSTVARFTTFLTYQQPSAEGDGGPLPRGRRDAGRLGQRRDHGRRRWPITAPSRRRSK